MKRTGILLLCVVILVACNNKSKSPDVSGVKVDLAVQRFDQDFFAIDTNKLQADLGKLQQQYPEFLNLYLSRIVGVETPAQINSFYLSYKPVYDSSQLLYKNLDPIKSALAEAFRHVRYYYPKYELPTTLVPVIGPMNSREDLARMPNGEYTPNFIGPGLVGISLQFYLGSNFSFYQTEYFINQVAPLYRSRRFSKEYIVPEVMKLITDDIYPDKSKNLPLLEQMVEKGKQWWLTDKFIPALPDSVKTGYTAVQLEFCRVNEGLIWNHIITNEKLDAIDPTTLQTYLGEAPFTQGLSQENSPGNIGQWVGWQIVKKYAEKHSGEKPEEILKATARKIIEEAKYRPK